MKDCNKKTLLFPLLNVQPVKILYWVPKGIINFNNNFMNA